jgi:predicted alpha/beta superfamily hydrolase
VKTLLNVVAVLFVVVRGCTGSPSSRIETLNFQSDIFGNERTLRVYMPKGYDAKKAYNILYLNDGQNLFGDHDGGAKSEWRVDETLDSLITASAIEPMIVVGIDSEERGNEYLPWEDIYLQPPVPHPHGDRYPDFLTEEVMPFIEKRYKVKTGRPHTGLGGSSYGGLIAWYSILKKPEYFGFAIIESPSFYVNDQKILEMSQHSEGPWPDRIYLGIGTNELALPDCDEENEDNLMAVNDMKRLVAIITEQSPTSKVDLFVDTCATHGEKAWARRFPRALEFVLNN